MEFWEPTTVQTVQRLMNRGRATSRRLQSIKVSGCGQSLRYPHLGATALNPPLGGTDARLTTNLGGASLPDRVRRPGGCSDVQLWLNQRIAAFGQNSLVPSNGHQPGKIQEAHSTLPVWFLLARSACPVPNNPKGTAWDWFTPPGSGWVPEGWFVDADDD